LTEEELQNATEPTFGVVDDATAPDAGAEPAVGAEQVEMEIEALKRSLADKEAAHADLEGQMRRLAADFDNYRRRQAQERENLVKFAGERILERFLDVMDNFERALQAGANATKPEDVLKGVDMIYRQVADFITKEGVVPMDAKGKTFDPNQHEAVVQSDVDDVPDQTVLDEFRKGYMLNGRVLRHAMVRIANNPAMPASSAKDASTSDADAASQS
jgi:molecular chaperone GrpE